MSQEKTAFPQMLDYYYRDHVILYLVLFQSNISEFVKQILCVQDYYPFSNPLPPRVCQYLSLCPICICVFGILTRI